MTEQPLADLGASVRARRIQLQLRQEELADLAGVSERFVYAVENGKKTVQLDKVLAVLNALGLHLEIRPRRRRRDPMTTALDDDLERLRVVELADVYKAGQRAATLRRTADGVEFRYLADWIDGEQAPVATTLPVGPAPIVRPGGALPSYFAGLLPEGRRLGALRRAVKTSADDELSLLLAVGADAIGDVQVVPAG